MARKRATLTDLLNDLTFKTLYNKFRLICLNQFTWKGLPKGITERHVENFLFEHGKAIFFQDPGMSWMCLEATPDINRNVYGDPLSWRAIGFNYNKEYKSEDCVIIRNNKDMLPTKDFVMYYVNLLTEAVRTMDVNVKACKTPYVFSCDENSLLTFKAIFEKIDGNVPAIYTDKQVNLNDLNVLQTGVKFLGNDLFDYKNNIENEFLTFLGKNNLPVDKKERMITDEANSNNQLIQSFRDIQYEARQEAAKEMSTFYGSPISVELRENDVENAVETVENGGDENE